MNHDFRQGLDPSWVVSEIGQGKVKTDTQGLHLTLPMIDDGRYHDAQISTYDSARSFQHEPPLRLTIRAYATHDGNHLRGTAGFGFWNHPYAPHERGFRLPQALWFFFASPPSHMPLALEGQAHGWKAGTFNAKRLPFYALLPTAPLAFPLMHIPPLYRPLWRIGQASIGVREAPLSAHLLAEPHTYRIEWLPDTARFWVDDVLVLTSQHAIPNNRLGLILWLDNQYAIISPKGQFGFGVVAVPQAQSLIIESLQLEKL